MSSAKPMEAARDVDSLRGVLRGDQVKDKTSGFKIYG
jgi:hypothetical protein